MGHGCSTGWSTTRAAAGAVAGEARWGMAPSSPPSTLPPLPLTHTRTAPGTVTLPRPPPPGAPTCTARGTFPRIGPSPTRHTYLHCTWHLPWNRSSPHQAHLLALHLAPSLESVLPPPGTPGTFPRIGPPPTRHTYLHCTRHLPWNRSSPHQAHLPALHLAPSLESVPQLRLGQVGRVALTLLRFHYALLGGGWGEARAGGVNDQQ